MSFDSEYLELRRKRKKKEDELKNKITNKKETKIVSAPNSTVKSTVTGPSASTVKRTVTAPSKLRDERDIAPVMKTFEPKKTTVTAPVRKSTAIAKAILGTAGDLGMNAASGAVGHIEGITDAVGYGAADIADKIGKGSLADRIREKTKESFTQKLFSDAIKTYGEYSLSGDFTDSVAQGIGQVGTSILGGTLLGGAGLAKGAVSAITTGATAMSGFGSGVGQAYEGGATDEESKKYGMIAGASEALTELLFGGMGKVSKALGHSKGLLSLDDMLAKKVSNIFSNQIVKNIAEFGVKSSAEGFEEVLAGMAQAVGKKITYMKDEDLKKILKDEKLLEQYLVGMTTSAIMQSGDLTNAIADKTDFITGLDQKEQAVVDKEVENRIAERERDGKKLSKRDKDKIYDEVKKALDEGAIDTDTIESVLGGETYKAYKDTTDNEAALQKEFDTLNKMKQGDMTGEQTDRRAELKEKLEEIKNSSKASQLKSQLSNEVSNLVKDSRLAESYNEKARRKETFKADLAKYDTKQQEVIKKAVESGILNNTRRTHGFVDMIAKISADKGVSFDFTSNQRLKESGFAIEGKSVNGIVTKDGIKINVNSAKALNSVVGHEITHILEGTELYSELQTMLKAVAESKGEYQSRYDEIAKLYEGVEGANIEQELTADLVGDYLFTDREFISRLSAEKPGVFKKIYNEIKYLCRVATAGSKEAKELEKVKKTFEELYRESKAEKNTAEGGVRYSITEPFTDSDGNNYENAVLLDTEFFDGISPRNWGSKLKKLVYNRSNNDPIILPITDEKGNTQQLQFAKPNERVVKKDNSNHKVIDKLSSSSDNISKLAVVHIDEIVEVSEENNPYYTNEHNHQWLDENGWLHRNANVINNKNGNIYNLIIDIAKTADGRTILYATNGKIKKVGNVHVNSLKIRGSGQNSNYEDIIPDSPENVKQKDNFSLSSKDTAPKKYGDYAVYGEDVMLEGEAKPTGKREFTAPTRESIAEGKAKENNFPMLDEDAAPALTDKQIADMQRESREAAESLTDADMPPQAEEPIYSADTIQLNKKTLKNVSDVGGKILMLNAKEKRSLTELIQKYSTSEDMDSEALFGEIKKLFGEKSFTERIEEVANVRQALSGYRIGVSSYIKNGISDYAEFRKRNFGKLLIANDGIPVDTAYMELSEAYPDFFPSDIVNPTDQLLQMAEVANMERYITNTYEVDDDVIREATETIGDMVGSYQEKQLIKATEREGKAILRDEERRARREQSEADKARRQAEKEAEPTRSKLHKSIVDGIKAKFTEKGLDFDKVLNNAKNISTIRLNDNTPQRAMEKTLGPKAGRILADETVNKVALNESEGIKWLNSYLDRKSGVLAQISKQYGIKPGSKESAAAQKYAEGFYVDERHKDKPIYKYDDAQLAKEFPDLKTQERIRGLATDERIRQIYDDTLEKINEARMRNLYPEIPRRDNYFLHFRAMNDTFSTLGLPFNPNDIRAKDLPTDLNGMTADLKPGQPYFPSANERKGIRTSFDLLGGLEQYLTSAKNQIYHIDDIQTLRAVRNYLADSFGQNILDNLDTLSDEEVDSRIDQMYDSHLSSFARFLNEEANVIAGKTALIDRGAEGLFGRKAITNLKTLNGQVGANMVGGNISSALTNFLAVPQALAKSSKGAFVKAFVQMSTNNIKSVFKKETDGFAENSPVIIRRKGAEQFYRKPYQKIGDVGYLLMSVVDNVSTEIIARTKFNEFTKKGMDEQTAHIETDKWVSRLMGDRSLGQMPLLYNSKTLGIITKFQLEVRNQLDSMFYDTIQETKVSNEEIENRLLRNAKTAAQVTSVFVQLAVLQHVFGQAFERVAGYNPAFDIIEVLAKMFGYGDDEEDEDTVLDNLGEGFLALLEDLPYTSTFTGGRIPISSALPSWDNIEQMVKGEDENGNKKSRLETAAKVLDEIAPYYILPGGAGQIKKTAKGLKMFDDDLPIAGSYTDSGKLRFPVEKTPWNVAQATLFGQYANKNAQTYFDEGYAPLKEKQIQEFKDLGLPIADYWKIREGQSKLKPEEGKKTVSTDQKAEYINTLNLPIDKKYVLKSYLYDEEEYKKDNPEKYAFLEKEGIGYIGYKELDEETQQSWSWAFKHQDEYRHYKENGIFPEDYSVYQVPMLDFNDEENKAYEWAFDYPDKASFGTIFSGGVKEYRKYATKLYEIKADKDGNGKAISGSAKKKKKAYIWSLDIPDEAKYILYRKAYPSDDTYNGAIINYVLGRSDISYDDKKTILEDLDFKIDDNGRIIWD